MPSNTTYNPPNAASFDKSKLNKNAQGATLTVTNSGVSNVDLLLADDHLLVGGFFMANPAAQGDFVNFQVLAPGGIVVAQYVTNWYLDPTTTKQDVPNSNFPAKIPAGFTLRLVYNATGSTGLLGLLNTQVWIAVLYDLQKVLL